MQFLDSIPGLKDGFHLALTRRYSFDVKRQLALNIGQKKLALGGNRALKLI